MSWLKETIKNLFSNTEKRTKVILDQETADSHKKMDHDRGMARGQLKQKHKEEEQDKKATKKANVSQYLHSQDKELSRRFMKNSASLNALFEEVKRGRDIELMSRSGNKSFGYLSSTHPVIVNDKGLIIILNEDNQPVTAGPTFGQILANPKGFAKEADRGILRLNVDEQGRYVPGPETVQTPQMILEPATNKFVTTEDYTEQYQEQVAQLKQELSNLRQEKGMLEKTLIEVIEDNKEKDRLLENQNAIIDKVEGQLERRSQEFNNVLDKFDGMQRNQKRLSNIADTYEQVAKDTIKVKEDIIDEVMDELDEDEVERAESRIRKAVDLVLNNADKIEKLRDNSQNTQQQQTQQTQQPPQGG